MQASQTIVYLKMNDRIQCKNNCIRVCDVATVVCSDKKRKKEIDGILLLRFHDTMDHRQNIGILWIIQKIQERFPDTCIQTMGPTDVIVEYIDRKSENSWQNRPLFQAVKIGFVSLISFFGGAFSIMAFHNDIGISELFRSLYEMFTGETGNGYTMLEISCSFGLTIGIILFFNHIGKRRITKDPTPIEVAMRMYEQDVNTTLSETWNRERKSIDAS